MVLISHVSRLAALSLLGLPAAALAQQAEPDPAPTAQPDSVETLEGVPEGFSLQPREAAPAGNRFEPMVQPVPQPSPTASQSRSQPAITVPDVRSETEAAVPRLTVPAQPQRSPQRESRVQQAAPASEVRDAPDTPVEPDAGTEPAGLPVADAPMQETVPVPAPSSADVGVSEAQVSDGGASGFGWMLWILGGILLAAIAAAILAWLRRRQGPAFVVEKIEPYRMPVPEPAKTEPAIAREPAGADPVTPASTNPGAAQGPVSGGGFVTSRLTVPSGQPRQAEPPAPAPAPAPNVATATGNRRFVSADGRIVTSFSPSRGG
ncbi:hypothetical protein [Aurantiacibacter hainanensis]|uniref:hypothetical protein n=1 Tax=Aurantiacibacter hainanensis TaxID=3076114 RepID=UPI0030C776E3